MKEYDFKFNESLVEGVIVERKGQFTMICEINGEINNCHCPTTGRIGNLDVSGLPCLLSKSSDIKRKTTYTVEAVSLNSPEDSDKSWIGINQNGANRYVEHYLVNGGFKDMVGSAVDKSITLGVEMWQANFEIQPEGVRLVRYFKREV